MALQTVVAAVCDGAVDGSSIGLVMAAEAGGRMMLPVSRSLTMRIVTTDAVEPLKRAVRILDLSLLLKTGRLDQPNGREPNE